MDRLNLVGDVLQGMISEAMQDIENEAFVGKDGFYYCKVCKEPRESMIHIGLTGEDIKVPNPCSCIKRAEKERIEAEKKEHLVNRIQQYRREGIQGTERLKMRFLYDDSEKTYPSIASRKYVERWHEMSNEGVGILFHGTVGTGKSFYACCITNALIDKGIRAKFTSMRNIINDLQDSRDKEGYINNLMQNSLLVIDDFGAESESSYRIEQMMTVLDARENSGRPLIITTNLTIDEMTNTTMQAQKRLYDRILGMCPIRIMMQGESRRSPETAEETAQRILWGKR